MEGSCADRTIVLLAAPKILGLRGTPLASLPLELLPALRQMLALPRYPTNPLKNFKEAWLFLNDEEYQELLRSFGPSRARELCSANGPDAFDRFRASHGWVPGVKRNDEPYMQERSYLRAIAAFCRSVGATKEKALQYALDYPEAYLFYHDQRAKGFWRRRATSTPKAGPKEREADPMWPF